MKGLWYEINIKSNTCTCTCKYNVEYRDVSGRMGYVCVLNGSVVYMYIRYNIKGYNCV